MKDKMKDVKPTEDQQKHMSESRHAMRDCERKLMGDDMGGMHGGTMGGGTPPTPPPAGDGSAMTPPPAVGSGLVDIRYSPSTNLISHDIEMSNRTHSYTLLNVRRK